MIKWITVEMVQLLGLAPNSLLTVSIKTKARKNRIFIKEFRFQFEN